MEDSFRLRWFWGVALPLAAATLAALVFLAGLCVPETAEPASRELLLHEWKLLKADRPEPLEQLRYLLAIGSVPLVFWLAGITADRAAAGRLGKCLQSRAGTAWVLTVQLALAALVAAMLSLQH